MGRFDQGVKFFTVAECEIQVNFPENDVACKWCPFIRHYDGLNRNRCDLTNEILVSTEYRGMKCPLTILNEVEKGDLNT